MEYPNKDDPPLSALGVAQAKTTGKYFKKYFADNDFKFDHIIIDCSPFLRCMMTASFIAEYLDVPEVTVNYKSIEMLRLKYFDSNPVTKLEFPQYSYDAVNMVLRNPEYKEKFSEHVQF